MALEPQTFDIAGVVLVTPRRFSDARGYFCETFNSRAFAAAGIALNFVQENQAYSAQQGTVRGLHFQAPPHAQAKLVRVTRGRILDVAVDIRRGSPSYGRHVAVELSAANGAQLFVPEGFAHGYCTLEPDTEMLYKVNDFYAPQSEGGLLWNDPALAIAWPADAGMSVAEKDRALPRLEDFQSPFSL
jgi:dTDP-4-dehydrorhamnose 3,5-epimerase